MLKVLLKCKKSPSPSIKESKRAIKTISGRNFGLKRGSCKIVFLSLCCVIAFYMKELVVDSLEGLKEVAEAVVESLDGRNVVLQKDQSRRTVHRAGGRTGRS